MRFVFCFAVVASLAVSAWAQVTCPSYVAGAPMLTVTSGSTWTRTNESGVTTTLDARTGEFTISKGGKLVVRVFLTNRKWIADTGFSGKRPWFDAFSESVRVGYGFRGLDLFQENSRVRHCARHAREFGIDPSLPGSDLVYEARALQFGRSTGHHQVSFQTYDDGHKLLIKYDVATEEFLVVNERRGTIISYYVLHPVRKKQEGFDGTLDFVLSQMRPPHRRE